MAKDKRSLEQLVQNPSVAQLEVLTVEETAVLLKTTRQVIAKLIDSGVLTATKIGGKRIITLADIQSLFEVYRGADLSNTVSMIQAKRDVESIKTKS